MAIIIVIHENRQGRKTQGYILSSRAQYFRPDKAAGIQPLPNELFFPSVNSVLTIRRKRLKDRCGNDIFGQKILFQHTLFDQKCPSIQGYILGSPIRLLANPKDSLAKALYLKVMGANPAFPGIPYKYVSRDHTKGYFEIILIFSPKIPCIHNPCLKNPPKQNAKFCPRKTP